MEWISIGNVKFNWKLPYKKQNYVDSHQTLSRKSIAIWLGPIGMSKCYKDFIKEIC